MVQIITNSNGGGGVGLYKYKGSVDYYEDLPTSGMKVGDTYNVVNAFTKDGKDYPAGTNVAWTGTDWDPLGGSIDLSDYQKKLVEGDGIDLDQDTNEISVESSVIEGAAAGATAVQPGDNVSTLNNDAGYITKDVNDLTYYTKSSDLAAVATSGKYCDLTGTPTLATVATSGKYCDLSGTPDLSGYQTTANMVCNLSGADNSHYPTAKAVADALSGAGQGDMLKSVYDPNNCSKDVFNYNNLYNKPTIPTNNNQLTNGCGYTTCTGTLVASDLTPYATTASLCTVATSGKYCDLTGTPTIPAAQIQSDWTQTCNTCKDYIKNKPNLCTVSTSGKYCDLTGTPSLATVATSGKYCDLTGTPTIPTNNNQLTNGCGYTTCTGTLVASDLTPYAKTCDLATVATSGKYCDLTGQPTIGTATLTIQKNGTTVNTFGANATSNVTANITVPTDTCELSNTAGFITGISCTDVTTALGYTPYSSANPSGYTTCTGTLTASNISDAAYGSGWNGVTTVAPSKNAVYDKISTMCVVPSGGTEGQVLTKTSSGCGWATASGGGDATYISSISTGDSYQFSAGSYKWVYLFNSSRGGEMVLIQALSGTTAKVLIRDITVDIWKMGDTIKLGNATNQVSIYGIT